MGMTRGFVFITVPETCWVEAVLARSTPPSKKAVSVFQIACKLLSFERFLKKLADDQCSSVTKGSI